MDILREKHNTYLKNTTLDFTRSLISELPWAERLIGVKGSRGVGKTTLLLQYIKKKYDLSTEALYVSLDDIIFTELKLVDVVDDFVKRGGKHLFVDEVHKYANWAIELKNIYDYHKELKVVFTGSSLLEILNSSADLSRRALVYNLQGLSFREYLELYYQLKFDIYSLEDILHKQSVSTEVSSKIKPLAYFSDYLRHGYYPFYSDNEALYYKKVNSVINMILEIELPLLRGVEVSKISKVKQLLYVVSQSVPFKPNITSLSNKIGVTRNTLVEYLRHLNDVNLLNSVNKNSFGVSLLQKPDKIFLENSNLSYALGNGIADVGNVRETFFLNQLNNDHKVTYPEKGDFLIDETYLFEVGGKNKTNKQLKNSENSYLAIDDLEISIGTKIPLWLFGFLY
jgi:predicted AAA+ superfamily ATPase